MTMVRVVGLCVTGSGAVVVVVRPEPARLAAVATAAWPAVDTGAAQRALARVRRRLRLDRWCPVAVVADPALADSGVTVRSAQLLARTGLAQSWVVPAGRAAELWSTVDVDVDPRLAPVVASQPAGLAVGAALAALQPAEPAAKPGTIDPDGSTVDRGGWAVAPIDDPDDPDRERTVRTGPDEPVVTRRSIPDRE